MPTCDPRPSFATKVWQPIVPPVLSAETVTPSTPTGFTRERLLRLLTGAPKAFWRCDVDLSLSAAVKMARFMQVAGVSATFYLNPRCDFYNLFSREGEATVDAIKDAGHRLGLHCDYRGKGYVDVFVDADLALIGAMYPSETFARRVSFHMPPETVLWRDFHWFENAYASEWEGRYVSDSRGVFTAEQEARVSDDMQINLHPEHWFS